MPDQQPAKPPASKAGAIAAICGAAALVCIPLVAPSEGEKLKPYRDPAHIVTWCYGETQGKPKDLYTDAECKSLLQNRLARDYAPAIAKCLPQLADEKRIKVFAAFLDAAYNAGPRAVCKSRMARSVKVDNWVGACNGFYGWYTTATDRRTGRHIQLRGLEIRRENEAKLCRSGL